MTDLILPRHVEIERPVAGPFPSLVRAGAYGPTRNLHLFAAARLARINAWLRRVGGPNRHNEPVYRVVWGWERPRLYGPGGGADLEFFHLERWMPLDHLVTEEEWEAGERRLLREFPHYVPEPYPRHGEYMTIRQCRRGVLNAENKRVAAFIWPDDYLCQGGLWYEEAFAIDQERLARTRAEIKEAVAEDQKLLKQREREEIQKIEDEFMIRELIEEETNALLRNPTLRGDPGFMLSPAKGKRRRRRATFH